MIIYPKIFVCFWKLLCDDLEKNVSALSQLHKHILSIKHFAVLFYFDSSDAYTQTELQYHFGWSHKHDQMRNEGYVNNSNGSI